MTDEDGLTDDRGSIDRGSADGESTDSGSTDSGSTDRVTPDGEGVSTARFPAELWALPTGYQDLFARLAAVVEPDERIRGLWLSGSLARGVADVGSDLDVVLAIRDEDFAGFADGWREWLTSITPTVLARPLEFAPGCFTSLTPDCLRFDVVAEPVGALPDTPFRRRAVVLDRDGLDADVPAPSEPPAPDPERLCWLADELFRRLAIFPAAVVGRGDWLLGVTGVHGDQRLLYDLFVEANQPLPPMGVKQWSAKLTAQQREVLAALPAPAPNRESVIEAMRATTQAVRTAGRDAVEAHGGAWPDELEQSVLGYVDRELGGVWT